jgi:hypothetical protein
MLPAAGHEIRDWFPGQKRTAEDEESSVDRGTEDLSDPAYPVPVPLPPTPCRWRESRQRASPISHPVYISADIRDAVDEFDGNNFQLHHPSRPTKRNPNSWTPVEDQRLIEAVMLNGTKNWAQVGTTMQLVTDGACNRTGKQCRERWHNHLDPTLSHAPFTAEEDAKLIRLQQIFDNKWTEISKRMPGRSDNAVKNRWNSCLSKADAATHSGGKKRSARSLSDSTHMVAPIRQPLNDSWHGNVEWGKTPLGSVQQAAIAELPCAVRSVRWSPPDAAVRVESSSTPSVATDFCFAEKCANIAQYGFRGPSGQVRRTRCKIHHEAGMYALSSIRLCFLLIFYFTGSLTRQRRIPQC